MVGFAADAHGLWKLPTGYNEHHQIPCIVMGARASGDAPVVSSALEQQRQRQRRFLWRRTSTEEARLGQKPRIRYRPASLASFVAWNSMLLQSISNGWLHVAVDLNRTCLA